MYGPFYSSKAAVGLIMSTGTIGQYLQEGDQINTYLSRDGGLQWSEVAKGSHIYEFGDHGGLIVMADDTHFTNVVQYSWNYGKTWNTLQISEEKFQIENIIIEPSATSRVFIVYGWQDNTGVMVFLDFTDLHTRICGGFDAPDSKESDYESWTPSDDRLTKCVMGHKVTYTRRKADRECYNTEITEHVQSIDNCQCTKEDFECDFGYERQESVDANGEADFTGPCIPMKEKSEHIDPEAGKECTSGKNTFFITKGYRRVAGDSCTGGGEWAPDEQKCPYFGHGASLSKIAFYLLLIIVIIVLILQCEKRFHGMNWLTTRFRAVNGYLLVSSDENSNTFDETSTFLNEDEFGNEPNVIPGGEKEVPKKRKSEADKPLKDARININRSTDDDFDPRGSD